ncbi:MAG: copper resistance protein CopC [Alphaproteobacteria bacterium]|nr:copper resistance protein CopC [Alphaproteobacteria bacterium]
MRKFTVQVFLAAIALVVTAGGASAHAALRHATPAAGTVLSEAPVEITLEFSAAIDVARAELKLTREAGDPIALRAPENAPLTATTLRKSIDAALAPGVYRIFWRVISVDGHWTRGDYTFEIAPPPAN